MPKPTENGRYLIQVTLTKKQYESLRRKAFEMETTVNKALVRLAMKELMQ